MQVHLEGIAKKFQNKWIFKDLSFSISTGHHYAITGRNGSGKSTLLMILAGFLSPTRGKIQWQDNNKKPLPSEKLFPYVAISSPYLELIEEFTLRESILFQSKFKPFVENKSVSQIIEISGLENIDNKPIRNFSSGMKQRARLLLAIMSQSPLLLLDEPCANLDATAVEWYHQLIESFAKDRTIITCSNNNPLEYPTAAHVIKL